MIYKIKDLMKVNRGSSPRPIIEYLSDSGYKWLKISDFNYRDRFVFETKEFIKEVKNTRHVEKGTLILTNSATPGIPIFLGEDMCLHDGFLYFTDVNENVNLNYLFYWFQKYRDSIVNLANGSVFKNLKKEIVENLEIDLPSINEQERIVKILGSLDEKLENNNKINNNLHELMEIQFNRWIEDLEEYEESNLTTIANYTNGLAMQKFRPNENEKSLPVVKIKEMNSGISQDTERCSLDVKDEVKVYDGDILFAWSGTLCMTIWCGGNAGLNQHIFKVTSDKYPKWFYYFWTLKYLNKFKMIAEGKTTTMGHIQRKELDNSEVKLPSEVELKRMNSIMEPLLEKYIANNVSNRTLEQLRDTLLPKLMNGEIDLDNIEI